MLKSYIFSTKDINFHKNKIKTNNYIANVDLNIQKFWIR